MLATKVICPRCSRKLTTPRPVSVGKHLRCSRCAESFTVRLEDMRNPTPSRAETQAESSSNAMIALPDEAPTDWDSAAKATQVATRVAPPRAATSAVTAAPPRKGLPWLLPALIVVLLVVFTAVAVTLTIYLGREDETTNPLPTTDVAEPEHSYQPAAAPIVEESEPEPPPLSLLASLPPAEQEQVKKAIERGLAYLRKSQQPDGTWPGGPAVGLAALPGLTLLECGVPANDPQIQKAAGLIRSGVPQLIATYELALAILFLDRLGDPADEALIQTLALRLIAGQTPAGGFYYNCPIITPNDESQLVTVLQETQPRTVKDLFVAGPDGKQPNWFRQGDSPATSPANPPGRDSASSIARLPAALQRVPALQIPLPDKAFPVQDAPSDNSNTQFAALGLWAAGRHGVPIDRALALLSNRFRASQAADGGWNYGYLQGGTSTPSMTGSGLLGLAVGHGLLANHTLSTGTRNNPDKRTVPDPVLDKGLKAIARHIGVKLPPDQPLNLYFLWTLERVAMLYNLPTIEGKDWYRWGAQQLVVTQTQPGHWDTKGYHGSGPVLDTSLALLFLQRANLAKDLTRKIQHLGRVREREPR